MLAQEQKIAYSEALKSIYDRRTAFSNANPFSARVVGQGTTFTYHQGVLCVLDGHVIRVSDLHSSSGYHEIDLAPVLGSIAESSSSSPSEPKISLMYYSDDIIAVHYERKGRPSNGRLFVISTKPNITQNERVIREVELESGYKLFVRHTSNYLYYGTYTGIGPHGHHEWEIFGVSLSTENPLPPCTQPLQLEDFFGTDINSTIAFVIHDGYFYAVSNQTTFDAEELDWTSFYHCIRFSLAQPLKEAVEVNQRVYRRQHKEGPIHDSWTDLTIQFNEATNDPMIVESRREWQNGSSRQTRTFYTTAITFEDDPTATPESGPLLPVDDVFSEMVDSTNHPNYAPEKARHTWEFHPEFPVNSEMTSRSFILARTKFRAYNLACTSFLDLVEDEKCCPNSSTGPCLRIRIGSRRIAPADWNAPGNGKGRVNFPVVKNDAEYRPSSIKMWPPPASKCLCSRRLHSILNPELPAGDGRNRVVTGVADERSLVYMIKNAKTYGKDESADKGVIVMVNFARDMEGQYFGQRVNSMDVGSGDRDRTMIQDVGEKSWNWSSACSKGQCR
jgi:hypothetical protein